MTPGRDILVVGDANPDLVLAGGPGELAYGQREQVVASGELVLGGSGSIMAHGAARLGLRVAIAACVGDDAHGRFVAEVLEAAGVDVSGLERRSDVATGISVIVVRGEDRAVMTAQGAIAALDPAAVDVAGARHVHVSSVFLQPRLPAGLGALCARAHAQGATVSVDTGWDPAERWEVALEGADVLLPNAQEALALSGEATVEAAGAALAAGGRVVAVKLGPEGAAGWGPGGVTARAAAPRVDAVDATGAGDSFAAGFLASWLEHRDLERALALGCACGALSTRAAGGTAAQPTRAEV